MTEALANVVLDILELLDAVLQWLRHDHPVMAICARVCRKWELPTLRLLWESHVPERALFSLLGVLHPRGPISFQEGPSFDHWLRFRRYANLVRDIRWSIASPVPDDVAAGHQRSDVSPSALREISLLAERADEPIFPSVTYISLMLRDDDSAIASTVLVHDTVRTLHLIQHGSCTGRYLSPLLNRIKCRCPQLRRLRLKVTMDGSDFMIPEVVETLQSLPRLEILELPSYFISDVRMWDALGTLPKLEHLQASQDRSHDYTAGNNNAVQSSLTFDNKFISLRGIDLSTTYSTAASLFTSSPPRDNMADVLLRISSDTRSTSSKLGNLLSPIIRAVPQLSCFCIALYFDNMRITLDDITPLLSVKSLRVLRACTDYVSLLTDGDYATLAASLPQLEVLEISPVPKDATPPPATLLALSHIARHCRQIESIAICLDTADERLPDINAPLSVFTHTIERINFGLSTVPAGQKLAHLLARMFSGTVPRIDGGDGWDMDLPYWIAPELWTRIEHGSVGWTSVCRAVETLLPFVDAVRRDASHQRATPNARSGI